MHNRANSKWISNLPRLSIIQIVFMRIQTVFLQYKLIAYESRKIMESKWLSCNFLLAYCLNWNEKWIFLHSFCGIQQNIDFGCNGRNYCCKTQDFKYYFQRCLNFNILSRICLLRNMNPFYTCLHCNVNLCGHGQLAIHFKLKWLCLFHCLKIHFALIISNSKLFKRVNTSSRNHS